MRSEAFRRAFSAVIALFAVLASGCVAPVGASSLSVPKDGASECASQCAVMGLRLSAVAIMANHIGCVCQPAASAQAQGENAVGPAGMATLEMIEEESKRQQQSHTQATRR